jgi:putative Ca2+/H+ antiporter (TMEM165/GDT1 family)
MGLLAVELDPGGQHRPQQAIEDLFQVHSPSSVITAANRVRHGRESNSPRFYHTRAVLLSAPLSHSFPEPTSVQHLLPIFVTVFLAELGDKTQIATLLFAADGKASPFGVFLAAATALVVSTALAVILGTFAERYLALLPLKLIAGIGFIAIGTWTIAEYYKVV